jgi:hypothetical protein
MVIAWQKLCFLQGHLEVRLSLSPGEQETSCNRLVKAFMGLLPSGPLFLLDLPILPLPEFPHGHDYIGDKLAPDGFVVGQDVLSP